MQIYGEITKIEPQDDGTIKVMGVASSGAVDEAEERILPAAMKAALPGYMRFGALREMHGMSAAGATLSAEVGDDGLTRIETHVVDPVAIKKVQLGVYKGFSIGGKVLERDPADRRVIVKIKLNEISLVDRPCNPEATIDMWKADWEPQFMATAPTNAEVIAQARLLAAAAGKPERHTQFVVKAREALIKAQAGASAPVINDDEDGEGTDNAADPGEGDADAGGASDPSAIADQLDAILAGLDPDAATQALAELLIRWAPANDVDPPTGMAASEKAARFGDLAAISASPRLFDEDLVRAAELAVAPQIGDLRRTLAQMEARLDKLAAGPLPPKAVAGLARAVGKTEDAAPGTADALSAEQFKKYLDGLPEDERGQLQLRAALRLPIPLAGR